MAEAVIVDAIRTPIGRAVKGSLKDMRVEDLAAVPIKEILARNPQLDPADIDDVIMGCGFPENEQGYNLGRQAAILAGIPFSVPAVTVTRFCSSSLQAIMMASHAVKAGEGDVYLCAGAEGVSRFTSMGLPQKLHPKLDGSEDALCNVYIPMGLTAENVAERYGVSRQLQDEWAVTSQARAVKAQETGQFDKEIVPVVTPEITLEDGTKIESQTVTKDDGPRAGTTYEKLSGLKPVFKEGGTVTAGNACPLNDGAAAVLVMSADKAKQLGLTPRARIVAGSAASVEPEFMGVGPIPAVKKVLSIANMAISDIDIIELNEAFAAQVIPCMDEWKVDPANLNPHGGAIALGHPFGQTGARIMTTLLNDLETLDRTYGLETMCVAGGQGQAMIVERLS